MRRKILCLCLALALCLCLIPAPALAVTDVDISALTWSLDTLDGGKFTQDSYPDETVLLAFVRTRKDDSGSYFMCGRSSRMMQSIASGGLARSEDVRVVVIDVDGVDRQTVETFRQELAPDAADVVFAYGPGGNSLLWKLLGRTGNSGGSIGLAVEFLIKDGRVWYCRDSVSAPGIKIFGDTEDWCRTPVIWAQAQGVTEGTSETTFSPRDPCTVAHILTFLYRAEGKPAVGGPSPFRDVPEGEWYTDAAIWAADRGLVSGDVLGRGEGCTRAMVVTYLWELAGRPTAGGNASFSDVSADAPYAQAVAWAVANGITEGTGNGKFSPEKVCTRGQIVTFLYRAYG